MLRQAGVRPEMHPAEMRDLLGRPAVKAVARLHGLDDPDVDRKRLEPARAEQQHAVGHFLAHAGQFAQPLLGLGVGQLLHLFQPVRPLGEEPGGLLHVARAEAEQAGPQVLLAHRGELGPRGQAVDPRHDFAAVPPGQQLDHLPDLDDLLGGAAEEAEQRLAQRLPQQAQARETPRGSAPGADRSARAGRRPAGRS